MLRSLRARLTAWYAGALALFLLVFAVAGYTFVARSTLARVDEALVATADDVVEALVAQRLRGVPPRVAILRVMRGFRLGEAAVGVLDVRGGGAVIAFETEPAEGADGAEAAGAAFPRMRDLPPPPPGFRAVLRAAPPRPLFTTVESTTRDGAPFRVYTRPLRYAGAPIVVGVAQSLATRARTLQEARLALAVGVPLVLVLAVAGGWALARQGLAPVSAMTERAARIGAGTLHERLPPGDPDDELGRLAAVFNDLLGRLENAFERQRRFMADASHELRTPVAIVRGETELALARDDRSPDELREALGTIGEEADRMRRIVDDLFLLARADAGAQPLVPTELYLNDLAADAAHAVRTLAARRDTAIEVDVGGDDLPVRGDEALLRRLVLNLLDNAIKHTPAGGRVRIATRAVGDHYQLDVSDTGPGISLEARERIFERFVRLDGAVGAAAERGSGAGLGLAIGRWIAAAHGGRLELARSDASGSTFRVTLPKGTGA